MERRTFRRWKDERVLVLSPTPTHPQDYGNRKRIYQVCRRLTEEGAKISFVHYPAEAEWRQRFPRSAARTMGAAWDQFFTVPPSRELHPQAKGRHHRIDEWWDESLGSFLRWIFAVQNFDTFIVNYAWLSKAFEFAPPHVLKILDTHDRLAGRREMLERLAAGPEFFYTTDEEEAIALRRADLVWAIKDSERAIFERLCATPVVTLPHIDPAWRRETPPPESDGRLRVGIVGARNTVNRINIGRFVNVAVGAFRKSFAPVKLVIAGSVCDILGDTSETFVELRGRPADMREFYASVDCVVVPIEFSTGLKIKVGEALAAGVPVLALAHAFDGYEACDRLHTLSTFEELAEALVEISFAPRDRLNALGQSSLRAHAKLIERIEDGLESTRKIVFARQHTIMLAVHSLAFVPGTIFHAVLESSHEYLKSFGNVTVLVVAGSAAHVAANEHLVDSLRRVIVAEDIPDAANYPDAFAAMNVPVEDIREMLVRRHPKLLIADALHSAFYGHQCSETTVFARTEMISLSEGRAQFGMPGAAFRRAFLVSPRPSRQVAAAREAISASQVIAPCLHRLPESVHRTLGRREKSDAVVLLGIPGAPATTMAAAMAKAWRLEPCLVCAADDWPGSPAAADTASVWVPASEYLNKLLNEDEALPRFAIDLSAGKTGLQLCREILERCNIPVVVAGSVALHRSISPPHVPCAASTESGLWRAFRVLGSGLDAETKAVLHRIQKEYQNGGGWARIQRFCTYLFETNDAEFA